MNTRSTVLGIRLVEMYEEGRDGYEEDVGDGVHKLCNMRREGVVVFTPVNRTGDPVK